jgi:hypothetical protein
MKRLKDKKTTRLYQQMQKKKKPFDKIQHYFMIKDLNKSSTEGIYLKILKAIYENSTVTNILTVKSW